MQNGVIWKNNYDIPQASIISIRPDIVFALYKVTDEKKCLPQSTGVVALSSKHTSFFFTIILICTCIDNFRHRIS